MDSLRRQIARALQGKTDTATADTVISDEHHNTAQYMEFINTHASNIERSVNITIPHA